MNADRGLFQLLYSDRTTQRVVASNDGQLVRIDLQTRYGASVVHRSDREWVYTDRSAIRISTDRRGYGVGTRNLDRCTRNDLVDIGRK